MARGHGSSPATPPVTVPRLVRDPVQSLRPWPVVVTFAGEDWTIPAQPAADWLAVLMSSPLEVDDIFPGLLDAEDQELVDDALVSSLSSFDEFERLVLDVIGVASGRDWWVALRLIELARQSWDLIGAELALKGVDADRVSLGSWLDVVLLTALRNMDPKDVTMFNLKLETPPVSEVETAPEMTMSKEAFMSMM